MPVSTLAQSPRRALADTKVLAIRGERHLELPDTVAAEEPLEVRLAAAADPARDVAVVMRTPGHDFELAVGFLLAEGFLTDPRAIRAVRYCDDVSADDQRYNVVTVTSAEAASRTPTRETAVSASCGVCGTTSIDQLERHVAPLGDGPFVDASVLVGLPDRLRRSQRVFDRTGGLHAAGLFRPDGDTVAVREDIGRHNAVDKLVGHAALSGRLPLDDTVLTVSGRVSFEIVQKAALAGVAVVVAVSAPSSLAVASARRLGLTLAAFTRGDRANLYSHPQRIRLGR